MAFSDYESFDGLGLANLVQNGIITPLELLDAAIERIEKKNLKLNAVIYKMYDLARSYIHNGVPQGLFQGVPFLLKDFLAEYAGVPMQFGSRIGRDYISLNDCELVKRFKNAGLVVVGKTNTPEFGLSPTTEPERFGPTLNPWDPARSAGGSSGGSAVAVASGMVPMAHGGDGAGSIRVPASYCGVFGLKPSRGRTPSGPKVMRIWQGMVVEHVITRSVRDNAAMLDVLAGPELGSVFALPKQEVSYLECLYKPVKTLRIGMCEQPFFPSTVNLEYRDALHKAGLLCQSLGHRVESVTPIINSSEVALAFLIVITAETAASMELLSKILKKIDYRELETATAILCEVGEHFSAEDFSWASYILDMTGRYMAEFFENHDVLMTPTIASPPPLIGEFKPDRLEKNLLELLRRVPYGPLLRKLTERNALKYFAFSPFTPLFNITGQPAMSVPLFWDKQGLPIGIQFAGRLGEENILLQLARQLEEAQPWVHKRPKVN